MGIGLSIIDSSIWVATITGFAAARHLRTNRFWIGGTFCTGSSTPKVPPRHHDAVRGRENLVEGADTAAGFSIFDRIAARPWASPAPRARPRALHEGQRQPVDAKLADELQVLAVLFAERGQRQHTSGTLTPLRSEIVPPTVTVQSAKSSPQVVHPQRILPSFTRSAAPGSSAAKISLCGRHAGRIAGRGVEVEPEGLTLYNLLGPWRIANPQLRSLQIGEDTDRAAGVLLDLRMILWRARISS